MESNEEISYRMRAVPRARKNLSILRELLMTGDL